MDLPQALLAPLLKTAVKMAIRRGVTIQHFVDTLKVLLVEEAVEEITQRRLNSTVSRIAVMTGLSRREVTNLLKSRKPASRGPGLVARVLNAWSQHEEFLDAAGNSKPLTYKGKDNEFKDLVKRLSQDIDPPTLLAELERTGSVEKNDDRVFLKEQKHILSPDRGKAMNLVARGMEALAISSGENIFDPAPIKNHHLHTEFNNIAVESLPDVRQWLLDEGSQFHKRIRDFLSSHDRDLNPRLVSRRGARVVLTSCSFTQPIESEEQDEVSKE